MSHANDLGYLLHHLAFSLDRQSDQILQERLGIGFSQFKILMVLKRHEGVRQNFIADYLGQTEASISRQIKLMTERGLITSNVRPDNRRVHVTTLTSKGLRLLDEAFTALNYYHSPVFGALSDKERAKFAEMLETMHREACRPDRPGNCKHLIFD